ncbi:10209_t:CDS:2 [Ambispora gerdemannii]|uniref:10209_t:CDS:1 n=1 Tax=Ambispora gerdemannii TaxID=144530 RepID=A0A9N9DBS8_9GLOM|nr:10209_t:CDS:2 [Ambispora gerdemannii]
MEKFGFVESKRLDFNTAISILGSHIHLDISPQSELATTFVSYYMHLMIGETIAQLFLLIVWDNMHPLAHLLERQVCEANEDL